MILVECCCICCCCRRGCYYACCLLSRSYSCLQIREERKELTRFHRGKTCLGGVGQEASCILLVSSWPVSSTIMEIYLSGLVAHPSLILAVRVEMAHCRRGVRSNRRQIANITLKFQGFFSLTSLVYRTFQVFGYEK